MLDLQQLSEAEDDSDEEGEDAGGTGPSASEREADLKQAYEDLQLDSNVRCVIHAGCDVIESFDEVLLCHHHKLRCPW